VRYELYIDKDAWMQRRHPVTKMTVLVVVFAISLIFNQPLPLLPLLVLVLLLTFTTGAATALRRFAFPLATLALLCFVLWTVIGSLGVSGGAGLRLIWFNVPPAAVLHAVAMTLRIIAMVLAGILFFATTTADELRAALVKMKVPQPMAFAITLSLRLFPAFVQSSFRILDAQRSRGLRISGNPIRRTVAYIPLIIPVFMNSLEQIRRLSLAIEARGYRPGRPRTSFLRLRFGVIDVVAIALALAALGIAISARLLICS